MELFKVDFQLEAIRKLMEAMELPKRDVVLKSCTGSGKTVILSQFMDEYFKSYGKQVFVWLTPGKGDLEEQSKAKMDLYIHGSQTKLLTDVMTSGFAENDACFINWEKLTKKGNNALKEGERTNFLEHIEHAKANGLTFNVIIDESHQNDTVKADDIIRYFSPNKIIRCSATPKGFTDATMIEIPEEEVIAAGYIKKMLVINENFEQNIQMDDQLAYLLDKALKKQQELYHEFHARNADVNPLIIVQLPNKNEVLQDHVERWFESQGINYENQQLSVWLSNQKQNLDGIEEPAATPIAIIIKQAVATGWDCPRAHILVKLRDNMDETFEIQTIGRIRRMPELKHYGCDLLDDCYLYTFDEKFTDSVKHSMEKGALQAVTLSLKSQYRDFSLPCEQKSGLAYVRDAAQSLRSIYSLFEKKYHITSRTAENKTLLQAYEYIIDSDILDYTKTGTVNTLNQANFGNLNDVSIRTKLNTHEHGREYHHRLGAIALQIGLEYSQMNTIIRKLFDRNSPSSKKILSLETRDVYAFVLNNTDRLKHDLREAMAQEAQWTLPAIRTLEKTFRFPPRFLFTYDQKAKNQSIREKNVYEGYLASAEPRSDSEREFEKFCENSPCVEWFYKNGDKGDEYFSVVYQDSFGKPKTFYPDYIVNVSGKVWIIETKGGFDRTGKSEDIDPFSPLKFDVLKKFLGAHHLQGGFVRKDKQSTELCLCTENYNDDIHSNNWVTLAEKWK